jgi:hypothetical protein
MVASGQGGDAVGAMFDAAGHAAQLQRAGVPAEEAAAHVQALAGVRERLQLLQWMVGVLVAGVGGLLLRAYG